MKLRNRTASPFVRSIATLVPSTASLALVFTASFAQAAERTWLGGDGNWTPGVAGGFNGAWAATASDNAVFSGTGSAVTIRGGPILFDATAATIPLAFTGSGYNLSASTAQTLTLGANTVNVRVTGGQTATIGDKVTVSRSGSMIIDGSTTTAGTLVVGSGGALTAVGSYTLGGAGRYLDLEVTGGSVTSSNATSANIVLGINATTTSTITLASNGVISTVTPASNTGLQFRLGTGTFNLNGGTLTTLSVAETAASSSGTSTFNFNGGTLRASAVNVGSYGLMSLVDVANVRNGGAIIDSNGFNVTVAQLLAQSAIPGDNAIDGGLEKKGAGSLTLTNSNTYTGVTKVSAGTLILGNASNTILNTAAVNVSGGILDVANNDTVGAVTLTSGSISGAGTLTSSSCDLQSGTITAALGGSATVSKSTSGIVNLGGTHSYNGPTNVTAGRLNVTGALSNTLLTVSNNATLGGEGSTTGNVILDTGSTLVFDPSTAGVNQYFRTSGAINATAGGVKLALATAITSGTGIVIAEAAGGWAGSTNANFTLLARGNAYISGNQLLYDFGIGNLTWKGNAANPSFWDLNTTQNWDNAGSPDAFFVGDNVSFGDSATTKVVVAQAPFSAGALTFTNTFGNDYTLSGAALSATNLSMSGSGKVTVSNTVTLSGGTTIGAGTLQLGDGTGATGSFSGAITNNGALITDFGANNVTISNAISGTGSLTQAGTGTVTLTGTNNYGTTTIETDGILQIGSATTTGSLGSGAVTNHGTLTFNRTNNFSVSNAIGGTGAVSKLGNNAVTLSVANGYSGATTIGSGSLVVTTNGALGTNADGTSVAAGASLVVSGGVDYATTETLSGSGSGVSSRGFIQSAVGNNTFRGNIELNADGLSRIGTQNSSSLTLTGTITQAAGITSSTILFRPGDTNGDFITLSNAGNSFGGDVQIFTNLLPSATNFAGVRLGVTNALPTDRTITALTNTAGTSSLDLNGYDQTLNGLGATTGTGILKVVNLNTSTPSKLTLTPTVDKTTSTTITIIGGAGLGEINVVKEGTLIQTLAGTHTYTGNTTINAGTLSLGAVNSNNESSTVTIAASGATLNLTHASSDTVGKLFIGATQLGVGVYGNIDSVLPIIARSEITGSGTLNVTSGPPVAGYSAWQAANGNNTQAIGLDHDSDGVSNGVEYFLGGNTDTTGFTPLPSVINTAGVLSITWMKATTYPGIYGTDFLVETSATLNNNWAIEASPGTVTITGDEVKFTFPTGTKNFARLKVTGP